MKNYKNIKTNVLHLLEQNPKLRDCNHTLVLAYYSEFHNISEHTPFCDVVKLIKDNKIPQFASLERASRQLQEQNENLRTENWYKRKNMEIPVKEELGYSHSNYRDFVK